MSIISIILLAAGLSAAILACYTSKQCERLSRSLTYSEYEKEKSAVKCEELEKALIDNKLPAATVGSLRDLERAKAIVDSVEEVVNSQNTNLVVQSLKDAIENVIPLRESSKHMNGRDLGRLEPTPSLKHMAVAV